ncbi:hypothetical protein [Candidatus Amarolinea dominans]
MDGRVKVNGKVVTELGTRVIRTKIRCCSMGTR